MLPFAWFYYIQKNQTESKVTFWNKSPIAHTYNFITTMQCQIQRISWPAEAIEYRPTGAYWCISGKCLNRESMYYVIVQSLKNCLLITAKFYHLQGLWLKGCLKMHFLQAECKSLSRSGADPDLQLRGGQIM